MSSKERPRLRSLGELQEGIRHHKETRKNYNAIGDDQEQDFTDQPGYRPSEIRSVVDSAASALHLELRQTILEGETGPASNPDSTETNHQKRTNVTSDTLLPLPLPPLPVIPGMMSTAQMTRTGLNNSGSSTQSQGGRSPGNRGARQEADPVQVAMNEEQQELLAWIIILERCETLTHMRKERRVALFNQCVTFVISVLGIIGGCIAIKAGVASATERR